MKLDTFFEQATQFAGQMVGLNETSQIGASLQRITGEMFPLAISEQTPVSDIPDFDQNELPLFSSLEIQSREISRLNPDTLQLETLKEEDAVLIEHFGYLFFLMEKMLETVEIGVWATLFAVLVSVPLAILGSQNFAPHRAIYLLIRSAVSFLRAMPELISALFLVLCFGFGPVAGILALGLHGVGFLGKFFAEEIETSDPKPQEALKALGASPLTILRLGVFPQILPALLGLSIYILDRNIRMATVVGLVGAGGIGQELRGRYDLFEYDRVGTALLLIFVVILALDLASAQIRKRVT
ncbi:MAG: phosphonate ABC transporter, permease protein PhnE [Ponticaulis sp.]|nr:phosphonate ABC transporter, permease protein PhnE [Ponticaulis sp.]